MIVQDLLAHKQPSLKTIGPRVRLQTVASLLNDYRIGAFPVVDESGHLIGIISERDVIREIATRGAEALVTVVEEVMTRNVITVTHDEPIKNVMNTMTMHRIRHLPVVDAEHRLVGIVSIGDIIKHRLHETQLENNILRDYALTR